MVGLRLRRSDIFYESHAMQNAVGSKGERGDQASSQQGRGCLRRYAVRVLEREGGRARAAWRMPADGGVCDGAAVQAATMRETVVMKGTPGERVRAEPPGALSRSRSTQTLPGCLSLFLDAGFLKTNVLDASVGSEGGSKKYARDG